MGELPRGKEQLVWMLNALNRTEEAAAIEATEPFRLNGTNDGLVRLRTGPAYSQPQNLIDF